MTATPPDDVAALFDLPPLPPAPSAESAAAALEAAEAALAAELAATIEPGILAGDAPDSRSKLRVDVSWPGRLQLPDGRVVSLEVRNLSEAGVGLLSGEPVPVGAVLAFEMDVPAPDSVELVACVRGRIKTTYAIVRGAEILCGATWQEAPAGQALVSRWIAGTPR